MRSDYKTMTSAGTAAEQLTTDKTMCTGVDVQSSITNAAASVVTVGNAAAQTIELSPGGSHLVRCDTANEAYAKFSGTGLKVNFAVVY